MFYNDYYYTSWTMDYTNINFLGHGGIWDTIPFKNQNLLRVSRKSRKSVGFIELYRGK